MMKSLVAWAALLACAALSACRGPHNAPHADREEPSRPLTTPTISGVPAPDIPAGVDLIVRVIGVDQGHVKDLTEVANISISRTGEGSVQRRSISGLFPGEALTVNASHEGYVFAGQSQTPAPHGLIWMGRPIEHLIILHAMASYELHVEIIGPEPLPPIRCTSPLKNALFTGDPIRVARAFPGRVGTATFRADTEGGTKAWSIRIPALAPGEHRKLHHRIEL